MTLPPTRLCVLLASESDSALILRRGPARWVAAIGWDRSRDTFKLGQWLKGRIEESACDLSPDGRHFLYQAKKYDPTTGLNSKVSYSVMSRVPYLTALHYWAPKHNIEGGAFFDNTRFWLKTYGWPEIRTLPQFARVKDVFPLEQSIADASIDTFRRLRDGWVLQPDDYQGRNLWHKTHGEYTLAWSIHNWRDKQRDLYELKCVSQEIISSDDWSWADFDPQRKRLCFTREGQLWELRLKDGATETVLHDFSDMQFEPRTAPYKKP